MSVPGFVRVGGVHVPVYGIFAALGLIAALLLSQRTAVKVGLSANALWDAGVFAVIAAFVASRTLLVAFDLQAFLKFPLLVLALPSLTYGGMALTGLMVWGWLRDRLYVDELYGATVIAFYDWWARVADWMDRRVWGGAVNGVTWAFHGWAHLNRFLDTYWVDGTFDKGCEELSAGGGLLSRVQTGRVQTYLRLLALGIVVLAVFLIWSSRG